MKEFLCNSDVLKIQSGYFFQSIHTRKKVVNDGETLCVDLAPNINEPSKMVVHWVCYKEMEIDLNDDMNDDMNMLFSFLVSYHELSAYTNAFNPRVS